MKGLRMAIAKHTITTILDTLGENDFVNIIAVMVISCSAAALTCSGKNTLFLHQKGFVSSHGAFHHRGDTPLHTGDF